MGPLTRKASFDLIVEGKDLKETQTVWEIHLLLRVS